MILQAIAIGPTQPLLECVQHVFIACLPADLLETGKMSAVLSSSGDMATDRGRSSTDFCLLEISSGVCGIIEML